MQRVKFSLKFAAVLILVLAMISPDLKVSLVNTAWSCSTVCTNFLLREAFLSFPSGKDLKAKYPSVLKSFVDESSLHFVSENQTYVLIFLALTNCSLILINKASY